MKRASCTPEQRAVCPIVRNGGECFQDVHHLEYPKSAYRSEMEKRHRELRLAKVVLPRCLHNAIHASGYVPEKPTREAMVDEIWNGESVRSYAERDRQLAIGQAVLQETIAKDDNAA